MARWYITRNGMVDLEKLAQIQVIIRYAHKSPDNLKAARVIGFTDFPSEEDFRNPSTHMFDYHESSDDSLSRGIVPLSDWMTEDRAALKFAEIQEYLLYGIPPLLVRLRSVSK
jgi:hypothetical protein